MKKRAAREAIVWSAATYPKIRQIAQQRETDEYQEVTEYRGPEFFGPAGHRSSRIQLWRKLILNKSEPRDLPPETAMANGDGESQYDGSAEDDAQEWQISRLARIGRIVNYFTIIMTIGMMTSLRNRIEVDAVVG